jgi:hypothetical protein
MQQNLMQLAGVDLVVPTHGIEGAKAYPLGLNCRVPLFDDTEDVFYIKSTDANGFPTIKAYEFKERVIIDPTTNNGVALQDIRELIREELKPIKEEILNAQQSVSAASGKQNKSHESSNSTTSKRNAASSTANTAAGQREGSSVVEVSQKQQ